MKDKRFHYGAVDKYLLQQQIQTRIFLISLGNCEVVTPC